MASPFPTEIVGCDLNAFVFICFFWSFVFLAWLDENPVSIALIIGLTLLTAWLWGKYEFMVLYVLCGIILFGLIGFLIYSFQDRIPEPVIVFMNMCVMLLISLIIFGGIYLILGKELRGQILHWGLIILGTICVLGVAGTFVWIAIDNITENNKRKHG